MCIREDCLDYIAGREGLDFFEAPDCGVGKSTICAGQGLFALKKFYNRVVVVDYSKSDWQRCLFTHIPAWHLQNDWWVGQDEELCYLGAFTSMFMRANHSRRPNTFWSTAYKTLVAIEDILPGEEITYDYRLEVAPPSFKCNPPPWA